MRSSRSRDPGMSTIRFDTTVTDVTPSAGAFAVETSQGDLLVDRVVVATGGLSVPATGSDGIGLDIARRLNHRMIDTYPALTPLVGSDEGHASLAGVSLNVRLRAKIGSLAHRSLGGGGKITETLGGFLFTHRGYSGPACWTSRT